jgi:uncharacterized membrane protein YfcA
LSENRESGGLTPADIMPFVEKVLLLFSAGLVAGVVNAIVGGGTLLTFPALLFSGMPAVRANATNTIGVLPGVISSQWAYRRELASQTRWFWRFLPPSLIGGLLGAFLLLHTEEALFRDLVPYLILFATVLFTFSGPISRRLQVEPQKVEKSRHAVAAGIIFQFCVGIYGGYFGAGIGILMLAALSMLGQKDIHEMNALRVSLGVATNALAAVYFIVSGLISWTEAGLVAAGTMAGGYVGPSVARAIGQKAVRIAVSALGFLVGIYFLLK